MYDSKFSESKLSNATVIIEATEVESLKNKMMTKTRLLMD